MESEASEVVDVGDERSLRTALDRHYGSTARLASILSGGAARDLVIATWLGVAREGKPLEARTLRATLLRRIWLGAITAEQKPRVPVVSGHFEREEDRWAGHWHAPLSPWPAGRNGADVRLVARRALTGLPPLIGAVVLLRDVEGLSLREAATILDLTEDIQRVMLNDGRRAIRDAIQAFQESQT